LGNENFRPLLIKAAALTGPPLAVTAVILARELQRTRPDLALPCTVPNSNGASKVTISELFGNSLKSCRLHTAQRR
jgi:hypothetical protein